jgi:hypothetical protein
MGFLHVRSLRSGPSDAPWPTRSRNGTWWGSRGPSGHRRSGSRFAGAWSARRGPEWDVTCLASWRDQTYSRLIYAQLNRSALHILLTIRCYCFASTDSCWITPAE